MVNYGVSRGCETCKKRKKRCDGAKPDCSLCRLSGIKCSGKRDSTSLVFRCYGISIPAGPISTSKSRTAWEGHESSLNIQWFVKNYVVEPANMNNSRGFLDGIQTIISSLPTSDCVRATSIVAMACRGSRREGSVLTQRATEQYVELLRSFRHGLSAPGAAWSVQTLLTVVLLGLYEIVNQDNRRASVPTAHTQGIYALLSEHRSNPMLSVSAGVELFQLANPLGLHGPLKDSELPGVLCAPVTCCHVLSLNEILIKCQLLFNEAEKVLGDLQTPEDGIFTLYRASQDVESMCTQWASTRFSGWQPRMLGFLTASMAETSSCEYAWPGIVTAYDDFYIAAVWSTYRQIHLSVLDVLNRCYRRLSIQDATYTIRDRAMEVANGLAATVPFHLAQDVAQYINASALGLEVPSGRPVGGLLLLHPLYVAANCDVVAPELRMYFIRCLSWIGKHMGIGRATMLSEMSSKNAPHSQAHFPFQTVADEQVLIWAGMLLRPVIDPSRRYTPRSNK